MRRRSGRCGIARLSNRPTVPATTRHGAANPDCSLDYDAADAPPPLTRADLEPWLDGLLPHALSRGDIAGAVVVVVKDGAVLLEKGYGYADVAARKPVDPQSTLFRPGSISKVFTATAVMQLVEQGMLDLDRDVNAYLDFRIPERDGVPVTLRNVLTHTTGFEEQLKGLIVTDPAYATSLEAYLKRWIPRRIFAAGETPAYSNYAMALANAWLGAGTCAVFAVRHRTLIPHKDLRY